MRTVRRECLDFLIPFSGSHLRRILREWVEHYNHGRPHKYLGPGIPQPLVPIPAPSPDRHVIPRGLRVRAPLSLEVSTTNIRLKNMPRKARTDLCSARNTVIGPGATFRWSWPSRYEATSLRGSSRRAATVRFDPWIYSDQPSLLPLVPSPVLLLSARHRFTRITSVLPPLTLGVLLKVSLTRFSTPQRLGAHFVNHFPTLS